MEDWVIEAKEQRSSNWWLQNGHGDVKYSIVTIVNNTVITMYGARWVLEILGNLFVKHMIV